MTTYDTGDGVALRHSVYDGNGELAAATVTVAVTKPDGTITAPDVSTSSTGVYEADEFTVDQAGVWTFTWTASGTVTDVTHGEFAVAAAAATGWATRTDVLDVTGVLVTAAHLRQAQATIEVYVNRNTDADAAASARDLYWLRQAVCWQAAWLTEQVTYHARSTFKIQVQDGHHLHADHAHNLQLAPLATRAIRNLSWTGNRVLSLAAPARIPPPAFNNEASDDTHLWEALR